MCIFFYFYYQNCYLLQYITLKSLLLEKHNIIQYTFSPFYQILLLYYDQYGLTGTPVTLLPKEEAVQL